MLSVRRNKMKKKGFTLIELLVVIAIIAMLLAILMPALNKVKKIAQRVVCGTNLKGLGTAQAVYANDYEDMYAKQGGTSTVSWWYETPGFQVPDKDWNAGAVTCSVGASLYLLVREADVSPKSFVCGSGGQTAYDGANTSDLNPDLVELWDFGSTSAIPDGDSGLGPRGHVSYSYHFPYSSRAATGAASASFAVMADKNPWFDPKLDESSGDITAVEAPGVVHRLYQYFLEGSTDTERWQKQVANAYPHNREGQNVVFGDGHSAYEKTSDVGVRHDNIYTIQVAGASTEGAIRCGVGAEDFYFVPDSPTAASSCNPIPVSAQDSMLVNDDT
jgi:prepilin-type N-terminal cleavage/methylation domain-containing protein